MTRAASTLAVALLCGACAASSQGEKAGLVRARVDSGALDVAHAGRRYALVIGVADFTDPRWRDLRFAAKDARDVAAALADPLRGAFDGVTVLASPEHTGKETLLAAIAQLGRSASRPEDIALVYVSSHGTLARDFRGQLRRYLVTADSAMADIAGTGLSMDALKEALDQIPSRRRVLILAACHSGTGKSLLPAELEAELASVKSAGFFSAPLEDASRAAMVFSASDWGETAREDESLQNDIYTHFWLEALDGRADRNLDGAVTATEAHDHARRRTYAFTQGGQRPSAEILEVGADPVVLAGRVSAQGNPEMFSYQPRLEGFTLKVDGAAVAQLPGGAAVAPGTRQVELTKGGHSLVTRQIRLREGERLELESLLLLTPRRFSVTAMGGGMSFLDPEGRSTNEVLPATWLAGAAVRYDDFPIPQLSLWIDAAGSAGRSTLRLGEGPAVSFRYAAMTGGVSVPFGWQLGQVRLMTGPRVAALWLSRSFALSGYSAQQSYFTVTPGWMAGATYSPTARFELAAQLQGVASYVRIDGLGQLLGFGGAWLGGGYRF